jgi:hypothetical protein
VNVFFGSLGCIALFDGLGDRVLCCIDNPWYMSDLVDLFGEPIETGLDQDRGRCLVD